MKVAFATNNTGEAGDLLDLWHAIVGNFVCAQ